MDRNDPDQALSNELNLGIGELDDQHQAFFMHVVGLRRALTEGRGGREKLMKTLRFLDTFVEDHFSAEEKYMRRFNYPGILVHKTEHQSFMRSVADFKKTALDLDARGEVTSFLTIDVMRRLEQWLTEHIRTIDRKMAEYLIKRM